jgi:hypothetical protein
VDGHIPIRAMTLGHTEQVSILSSTVLVLGGQITASTELGINILYTVGQLWNSTTWSSKLWSSKLWILHERVLETSSARLAVAFYYFDKVSKELTASAIIKSIAYQLCMQNPEFFNRAFSLATESGTEITTLASNLMFNFWDNLIVELSSDASDSAILRF